MVRDELRSKKEQKVVVEDLLDHLLAKDTSEGVGCDNMTVLLITFNSGK
jgi:serine/threonine protein phosphatase PrpC